MADHARGIEASCQVGADTRCRCKTDTLGRVEVVVGKVERERDFALELEEPEVVLVDVTGVKRAAACRVT